MKRCVVLVFLLLVGCAPKQISEMSYTEVRAVAGEIRQRCADQGAPPGSPNFEACSKQEVAREVYTRQAGAVRAANARAALASGMAQAGANMQRNAIANRPINCTSTRGYGSTVHTNCY